MKKITLLAALIILIFTVKTKATEYVGGEISYVPLGGSSYEVSYNFYRECFNMPAPSTMEISFKCASNPTLNFTSNLSLQSSLSQQITTNCSAMPSYCNGGTAFGVEELVYKGTVNLPPCAEWEISRSLCCRFPLSTINGTPSYYNLTTLKNDLSITNTTPIITNVINPVACNGLTVNYNPMVYDADGDSLVFSWHAPYTTSTSTQVQYNSPYSASDFLLSSTPITLNSSTGEISFTPSFNQNALLGLKIEEWRNISGVNTLVGVKYIDMQIRVINCENTATPILSGMDTSLTTGYNPNDTIYNLTANVGIPINFYIHGFDADTFNSQNTGDPEKFEIYWNQGIPGANFQVIYNGTDSSYVDFSWTPTMTDYGKTYNFKVGIKDKACPYASVNSAIYNINVDSINTTSIISTEKPEVLRFSPMPVKDILLIRQNDIKDRHLILYTIDGKIAKEIFINSSFTEINLSDLAPGMYIMKSVNEDGIINKIIKL